MEVVKRYSDQELVQALQSGKNIDPVIKFLYREHFEGLSMYITNNHGSRQDAEDIFQEAIVAFIALVQKDKFRGESSIKTFLYAINKNMWLNELKRKDRASIRDNKFESSKDLIDVDTIKQISDREAKMQIMGIMDKLGQVCKKILLNFYFDNLSMKEIMGTMNYENEQVLRNKKYKCLKQLEELLTADPLLATTLKTALKYEQ